VILSLFFVYGKARMDFTDWPDCWKKHPPETAGALLFSKYFSTNIIPRKKRVQKGLSSIAVMIAGIY
jgi:hypothetical protein